MRISTRLLRGGGLVMLMLVLVGVVGVVGMGLFQNAQAKRHANRLEALLQINNADNAFRNLRIYARQIIIYSSYDDKTSAENTLRRFENYANMFRLFMNRSREMASTAEMIDFHDTIMEIFDTAYLPLLRDTLVLSIYDIPQHYHTLHVNAAFSLASEYGEIIGSLFTGITESHRIQNWYSDIDDKQAMDIFIAVLAVFFAVIIWRAAVKAYRLVDIVTKPVAEASWVLRRMAQGDFSPRVIGEYEGDMKELKDSINDTGDKLNSYVAMAVKTEKDAHKSALSIARIEAANEATMDSILYASRIQNNLLPAPSAFETAFTDYAVIWKPRDIVGGDIYWIKNFDAGTVLCVCDCTGHGVPGALLTMLVVSIFEATVDETNCADTAGIIWRLEKRLENIFNINKQQDDGAIKEGCDLAVLFVAKDGGITLSSAHTPVFICDGRETQRLRGQNIYGGEGRLESADEIETHYIPAKPGQKIYVASDGLFEQVGGPLGEPYAYKQFTEIILTNHNEPLAVISEKIWEAFETYRNREARVDDFELVSFTV